MIQYSEYSVPSGGIQTLLLIVLVTQIRLSFGFFTVPPRDSYVLYEIQDPSEDLTFHCLHTHPFFAANNGSFLGGERRGRMLVQLCGLVTQGHMKEEETDHMHTKKNQENGSLLSAKVITEEL